ncbi:MAG TPA: CAP domain-containing protein [Nitrososphaerales archaeon]|nr:CAP domain-containing protein [Nitrososphaerales archaeon]
MSSLTTKVLAAFVLVVVIAWAGGTYLQYGLDRTPAGTSSASAEASTSGSSSSVVTSAGGGPSASWLPDNPALVGNSSKIDTPPDYGALANFTLSVINGDRASAGLALVALSSVPSGQQHADSMAYFGYFSHWDNQGYKPYMRYTLLGGTGSVSENAALNYCTTSPPDTKHPAAAPCSLQSVENAINGSEWMMMNNDSTCCNNGHRANILDPLHDRVSVGVAYNSTTVYLVEDFENSYIGSESLQVSSGVVTFQGAVLPYQKGWMERPSGAEISVFYDPTPSGISVSDLNLLASCVQYNELSEPASCQYQGAYNPGAQIFTIFPPCPPQDGCSGAANYTYAQAWQLNFNTGQFDIVFPIAVLEAAHGNGVYTFYLWPSESTPDPITSVSVFVTGQ